MQAREDIITLAHNRSVTIIVPGWQSTATRSRYAQCFGVDPPRRTTDALERVFTVFEAWAENELADGDTPTLLIEIMRKSKPKELTEEQAQLIAKALADPRRYEIVKRISQCENNSIACETVRECFDITAPTLSHHMKELEIAGLIQPQRSGKFISYQLRRDVLNSFMSRLRRDFAKSEPWAKAGDL